MRPGSCTEPKLPGHETCRQPQHMSQLTAASMREGAFLGTARPDTFLQRPDRLKRGPPPAERPEAPGKGVTGAWCTLVPVL